MRKFKHKQTGDVVTESTGYGKYYQGITEGKDKIYLPPSLVEQSNDWEEVVTPTFKILSLISSHGYIAKGKGTIYQYVYGGYSGYKIHSIERLSDGEIFTLEDKIDGKFSVRKTILEIKIDENGGISFRQEHGHTSLEDAKHIAREIIYTTYDGVDRYEPTEEHWVINDSYSYKLIVDKSLGLVKRSPEIYKIFSTEEAANEYVRKLNPEPLYTTYDGVKRFEYQREYWVIKDTYIPSHDFTICEYNLIGSLSEPTTWKIFSTEEKALEYVESVKPKPLFTSEDGVEIFEGDSIFYVETDDAPENSYKVNTYKVQQAGRFTSDKTIYAFSTKEAAEDWILHNRPVISLKDLLDLRYAGGGAYFLKGSRTYTKIKQIVEDRNK